MLLFLALIVGGLGAIAAAGPLPPTRLRMEYMENPQGVDVPYQPRLSWALGHTERGQAQTAYEIAVSEFTASGWHSSWMSGKVSSNVSQNVHLGAPLTADSLYTWTVRFTDTTGVVSAWADNATFTTAPAKWTASWIQPASPGGAFLARKTFTLPAGAVVTRATVSCVGLGYYKLFVNGQKASNHELGPFTTFEKRVYYDTYDITDTFSFGMSTNTIGLSVGPGWYAQKSVASGSPLAILQAKVFLADGSVVSVDTDATWMVGPSPVTSVDIYTGENYDAQLETTGWSSGASLTPAWTAAKVIPYPHDGMILTSHAVLPRIQIGEDYTPCDMWESSPGVWVFDFCQNMAGFTTLRIPEGLATVAGAWISQQHAEAILGPKPAPIHNHYKNAPEINNYTARGDGEAIEYTAQFTYAGFRYVALTNYPGVPTFDTVTAHFVHTAYDFIGDVSFSDPMLTAVQHITRTAAMSNFQSIPTDCPQRERRGWLGDAQLSAETNFHNFDMAAAYTSFIQQMGDSQGSAGDIQDCVPWYGHGMDPADPAWGAAFSHISDWLGTYYHDDQIFGQHYDQIKAHLEQLITTAKANNFDGLLTYGGWSDWCPPEGCHACWERPNLADSRNSIVVSSFYYISELRIVARYAGILGKPNDETRYSALAASAVDAFNRNFYDATRKTYVENNRTCGERLSVQTLISLAAALDIIPTADFDAVMDNLVADVAANDWHLDVGIVGIKYLLGTLSNAGRGDVALMIAQARTPPSYIYMVEQGATTLWETWTGSTYDPVASWNHIMFGSNSDWYYKFLGGLRMASSTRGWQHLELRPQVYNDHRGVSICANLSSTSASIITPRGPLIGEWHCLGANPSMCDEVNEKESAEVSCSHGTISTVKFASFGLPEGSCQTSLSVNASCDAPDSRAVVEKMCLGKPSCAIPASDQLFHDPCFNVSKRLAVQIECSASGPSPIFEYDVTIPVGSVATVILSTFGNSQNAVTEGGITVWSDGKFQAGVRGVTAGTTDGKSISLTVGSGKYSFQVEQN